MDTSDDRHELMRRRRVQYETDGLDVSDVVGDPIEQWHRWHDDAVAAGVVEPNAMTVSTIDLDGVPDARVVLTRGADRFGFVFYTNYESEKSRQLNARPVAACTFSWLDLHRQVRARGTVERVTDRESDEYFATRPRESQLGAWASPQSAEITNRAELDRLVAEQHERFADEVEVTRPPHWGGWRIVPNEIEFWQGRPSRLHDRIMYRLIDDTWHIVRLAP